MEFGKRHDTTDNGLLLVPTCYRLVMDLSFMLRTCYGLVSDTTGRSPTCYGISIVTEGDKPPTGPGGPGLDSEIRANPMRSVNT